MQNANSKHPCVVLDSLKIIQDSLYVIPDSIRDPAPRQLWIADQVRNDN
jgi:hypothetical protein